LLPTPYQEFIHLSRYARWVEAENRRETWDETVSRYMNFMREHLAESQGYEMSTQLYDELYSAIYNLEVLPSMRALMTAGPALKRNAIAGYNCSYIPIDHPRAFDEIMYVLCNGTGVGFSVESQYTEKLPVVNDVFHNSETVIVVGDSKEGWAAAFRELLSLLWAGQVPSWNVDKVRPAGARLKTFGGRASGPEPLVELFEFTVELFRSAAGRKLTPLECHDLACKIGEVVVVGGVRRSALISLTDLEDYGMASAKMGAWWKATPERALANISTAYESKPEVGLFMQEWKNLYDSKSGERGIFNRQAARKQVAKSGRRDENHVWGTNPCSEIILRPNQFCNLSTVVVRETDGFDALARKVQLATILGTMQATLTNFKYIRSVWKKNTEEERLLGVSMTGPFGHPTLSGRNGAEPLNKMLEALKHEAVQTNKFFAEDFGIPQAAAVTCIKPEGTSSQLVNASSGLHPWHSEHYIRTVRGDVKDPLTQFMVDAGFPAEPDVMKPDSGMVFSFPMKAPEGAITNDNLSAIEHLEIWLAYQRYWCEHKPSVTITVREDEWMQVGAWVYEHFDELSGVSFLPYSDHSYKQAPFQSINEFEYEELVSQIPDIDWTLLRHYETEDTTSGTQNLACSANTCEIVDIGG